MVETLQQGLGMNKDRSVKARTIEALIFMMAGSTLGWVMLRMPASGHILWLGSLLTWGTAGWILGEREAAKRADNACKVVKSEGLVTGSELRATLERELALAARRSFPLTLLLIDVKNIEVINRDFDREAGDEAMKAVALAARKSLRETDWLARTSGLTFCAILPDSTVDAAATAVVRTQLALGEILRSHPKGEVHVVCKVKAFAWDGKESGPELMERTHKEITS